MLARVRDRLTYANVITSLAHFLGCPGRDQVLGSKCRDI